MEQHIQYRWRYVKFEGSISTKLCGEWSEWYRSTEENGRLIFPENSWGFQVEYQVRIEEAQDAS